MNEAVIAIARQTRTPLVDACRLFERLNPGGIPGHQWLVDHEHPFIRGQQVLTGELVSELMRLNVLRPKPGWEETRDRRFAQHLAALDTVYFIHGQQHFETLARWAEGLIMKEQPLAPIASTLP
jgi:hypothetical protein